VRFNDAIDIYVSDMFAQGRFSSLATEVGYRAALHRHADDVSNRDPRYVNRDDVKRTLRHWTHPNSQRKNRAVLVSFYDYLVEEGIRKDNPARQTRRPRPKQPQVYRLTKQEAHGLLAAARGVRERRAIFLGVCAGLRARELRGLRGRHFERPGWVWVSPDIAKGGRERWVPVLADLEPVIAEIRSDVAEDEYVLPAQRFRDVGINRHKLDYRRNPCSAQALYYLVKRVGKRAGIAADLHPHLLRHAYGDHVARHAGMRNAQFLLGHAGIATTETYVGQPTLDELALSVSGLTFGFDFEQAFQGTVRPPERPLEATTGIEPVWLLSRFSKRFTFGTVAIGRPNLGF
jgi:site-specific recombinase XerD